MQLDERQIRAFALLKNPELQPVVEWLKAQRAETLERLATPSVSADIGVMQGEASAYKKIIDTIAQCGSVVQRNNSKLQPVPR